MRWCRPDEHAIQGRRSVAWRFVDRSMGPIRIAILDGDLALPWDGPGIMRKWMMKL